jgi:hypothetical protein
MKGFAATAPADANITDVARAIVQVVDTPFDTRPFWGPRRSSPG